MAVPAAAVPQALYSPNNHHAYITGLKGFKQMCDDINAGRVDSAQLSKITYQSPRDEDLGEAQTEHDPFRKHPKDRFDRVRDLVVVVHLLPRGPGEKDEKRQRTLHHLLKKFRYVKRVAIASADTTYGDVDLGDIDWSGGRDPADAKVGPIKWIGGLKCLTFSTIGPHFYPEGILQHLSEPISIVLDLVCAVPHVFGSAVDYEAHTELNMLDDALGGSSPFTLGKKRHSEQSYVDSDMVSEVVLRVKDEEQARHTLAMIQAIGAEFGVKGKTQALWEEKLVFHLVDTDTRARLAHDENADGAPEYDLVFV